MRGPQQVDISDSDPKTYPDVKPCDVITNDAVLQENLKDASAIALCRHMPFPSFHWMSRAASATSRACSLTG